MIASDTSVWISYLKGSESKLTRRLEQALSSGSLVLPPPVLMELLSGPGTTTELEKLFLRLPRLTITDGLWERAGGMRKYVLKKRRTARSMDCLIAQICIDEAIALLTEDRDFRYFEPFGLKLVAY